MYGSRSIQIELDEPLDVIEARLQERVHEPSMASPIGQPPFGRHLRGTVANHVLALTVQGGCLRFGPANVTGRVTESGTGACISVTVWPQWWRVAMVSAVVGLALYSSVSGSANPDDAAAMVGASFCAFAYLCLDAWAYRANRGITHALLLAYVTGSEDWKADDWDRSLDRLPAPNDVSG